MKKALLFGASGLVGSYLLQELLDNPRYGQVTVVVRRAIALKHPKLKVLIGDYRTLPSLKDKLTVDDVFITLGTTQKKTPNRADYYQIDHDYPVLAAKVAKERGATAVFLLTAVGANPNSNMFYVRTKGETERDVIALGLQHTHIFRPSIILGDRGEFRLMEKIAIILWPLVDWLLGALSLKKYRGIQAKDIAKAMVKAADSAVGGVAIYEWQEMKGLTTS